MAYLVHRGAEAAEAEELVGQLWADCLVGEQGRPAALSRYQGSAALLTWLNSVVFNRLISRRRKAASWSKIVEADGAAALSDESAQPAADTPEKGAEPPLLEILRVAVQTAFGECPPEDFVMLQLVHRDGLRMAELAKIFNCSEATISRKIERAASELAAATLAHVKAADRWIELGWDDFLELCRTVSPSALGVE